MQLMITNIREVDFEIKFLFISKFHFEVKFCAERERKNENKLII